MIGESLPPNAGRPTLGPQSSILGEMMIIGLTADTTSMEELRTIADWTIRPRLLSTGGVAQVAVLGGDIREYQVLLNPEKMKHYGIGLDEVMKVVRDMNQNASGGVLYEYGNEYIIRGVISTNDVDALSKAVLKRVGRGTALAGRCGRCTYRREDAETRRSIAPRQAGRIADGHETAAYEHARSDAEARRFHRRIAKNDAP